MSGAIQVDELTDVSAFLNFEDEWRALFESTPDSTPFQSWEWLSMWWKHKGRGQPWILIAREGDTTLCAMALTITHYRGTMFRQARWMGAPLSDYQDTVGGMRRGECAAAFLAHLAANYHRWDLCDLNDLRNGSPLTGAPLVAVRGSLVFHRKCPRIQLPSC